MFTCSLLATLRCLGHFPAYSASLPKCWKPLPTLSDNNLFHPFSKSPFPAVCVRGEAIQHAGELPLWVKYKCPDCRWPIHCLEEHWQVDEEHKKYYSCLWEVNEDEHDLRRGRKLWEFQLPGAYEEAISFANWDLFWYTSGFPSMDTGQSRRHASKLLTYPLTIGSIALCTTLHVPPGAPDTEKAGAAKPQIRVFILGAHAESSLPPHVWEQLCMLFPSCHFHLLFIRPQHTWSSIQLYGFPSYTVPYSLQLTVMGIQAKYSEVHQHFEELFSPYADVFFLFSPGFSFPSMTSVSELHGTPLPQINSPTEWGPVMTVLLETCCSVIVTRFSPADMERDICSLECWRL
ncbi:zinc-finger of mitochondrial splicing suppressor 51-domain-containing protein [Pisolithus marmoratus]|nr:zinc-finger of mitochondrial splicing suppressor 51-domain-containing protein [Pisolithus marmoratus]